MLRARKNGPRITAVNSILRKNLRRSAARTGSLHSAVCVPLMKQQLCILRAAITVWPGGARSVCVPTSMIIGILRGSRISGVLERRCPLRLLRCLIQAGAADGGTWLHLRADLTPARRSKHIERPARSSTIERVTRISSCPMQAPMEVRSATSRPQSHSRCETTDHLSS